jgi:lysosomal alpha-glucosidase
MNLSNRFYVAILLALILVNLAQCAVRDGPVCAEVNDEDRFDCFPEFGANQEECVARGCCWRPPKFTKFHELKSTLNKHNTKLLLDIPYCYYPESFPNYQVVKKVKTDSGHVYSLQKRNATFRPNEILKLEVRVIYETSQRLRVQIVDPNDDRYEVPDVSGIRTDSRLNVDDETDYQFYVNESPFYIQVFRKSTGKVM